MNLNWLEWILPALLAVTLLAVGLGAGWVGCLLWQRRRELNALRELVTQLHLKRALAAEGPGGGDPVHDAARCRSAVADARGQIREALAELRPGSVKLAAVLIEMEAACAAYLARVAAEPSGYANRLSALRLELHTGLRRLCSLREDLEYLAPGQRTDLRAGERAAAAARVAEQLAKRRAAEGTTSAPASAADKPARIPAAAKATAGTRIGATEHTTARTGHLAGAAGSHESAMMHGAGHPASASAAVGNLRSRTAGRPVISAASGAQLALAAPQEATPAVDQPRHRASTGTDGSGARRSLLRGRARRGTPDAGSPWMPADPAATSMEGPATPAVEPPDPVAQTAAEPVTESAAPVTAAAASAPAVPAVPAQPPVPAQPVDPAPAAVVPAGGKSSIKKGSRNRRRQKV